MGPEARPLVTHAALLAVSGATAAFVWLHGVAPPQAITRDIVVWRGREADVSKIELHRATYSAVLEAQSDANGRWYRAKVHDEKPKDPHGGGGGPAKDSVFASVGPATRVAEKLADLRALRDLGHVPPEREQDYGLKDAEAKLQITLRNETRSLALGASAPGGTDRYVRDERSGEVYVVEAEPMKALEAGDRQLLDHELHSFTVDPEVDHISLSSGEKKRDWLRRGPATSRFFADPSAPDKADETLTTWITKVERLRPTDFIEGDPNVDPATVVRLEYASGKTQLGYLDVARGKDNEIYIRTERTRMWAKVMRASGDAVLSDVGGLLK